MQTVLTMQLTLNNYPIHRQKQQPQNMYFKFQLERKDLHWWKSLFRNDGKSIVRYPANMQSVHNTFITIKKLYFNPINSQDCPVVIKFLLISRKLPSQTDCKFSRAIQEHPLPWRVAGQLRHVASEYIWYSDSVHPLWKLQRYIIRTELQCHATILGGHSVKDVKTTN